MYTTSVLSKTRFTLTISTIVALVVGLFAYAFPVLRVSAASLTNMSDTLSRHEISTASDHTILFTTSTGVAAGETITVTFESDMSVSASLDFEDLDLSYEAAGGDDVCDTGDTEETLAAAPSAGVAWGAVRTSATVITFTSSDQTIPAGAQVCVEIGTVAEEGTTGVEQVTNASSAGDYTVTIGGTMTDTGTMVVPAVDSDQVTVSAEVGATLTFDLDTVESGATPCDSTSQDAAPYAVDLGTLTSGAVSSSGDGSIFSICVEQIETTAGGGMIVQVASLNDALDSTSTPADTIENGAGGALSAGTEGYGVCVESTSATTGTLNADADWDGDGSNDGCDPGTDHVVGDFPASNAFDTVLDSNNAPIIDGFSEVLVKSAISGTTEAHDDYTDTLTFRATGTF